MDSLWSDLTETITQSIDQASKVLEEVNHYDILNFDEMAANQEQEEKKRIQEDEEEDEENVNETTYNLDSNETVEVNHNDSTINQIFKSKFIDNEDRESDRYTTTTSESKVLFDDSLPIRVNNNDDNESAGMDETKKSLLSCTSAITTTLHGHDDDDHIESYSEPRKISSSSSIIITTPVDRSDQLNVVDNSTKDTTSLPNQSISKNSRKAKKKNKNKKKQLDFFGLTTTVSSEDSINENTVVNTTTTVTSLSDMHPVGNPLLFSDILPHVPEEEEHHIHINQLYSKPFGEGEVKEVDSVDNRTAESEGTASGGGQELLQTFNNFFHASTTTHTLSRDFDLSQTDSSSRSSSSAVNVHKDEKESSSSLYSQIGILTRHPAVEVKISPPVKSFFDNDLEEVDVVVPSSDPSKKLKPSDLERILYPQLHHLLPSLPAAGESLLKDHAIEIINGKENENNDDSNQSQLLHDNHDITSIILAIIYAICMTLFAILMSLGSGLLVLYNLIQVGICLLLVSYTYIS